MPRLTPQELHEARRRKKEEEASKWQAQREQQRRGEEEQELQHRRTEQEQELLRQRNQQVAARRTAHHKQHNALSTSLNALYVEVDKLAKKAPTEQLTDLNMQMVNDLITDIRLLVGEDHQLRRIRVVEPAGDNLQYRDALIILGQLQSSLRRLELNNFDILAEVE